MELTAPMFSSKSTAQSRAIKFVLFLLFVFTAPSVFAQGGPPLITDDPGTPGNKHWEINIAFTETRLATGVVYELPHLDLNYGYGDNVQLKLEGPLTIFNGDGSTSFTGLGYTNWGVKWRFQNDSKTRPALSTYPQIIFVGNQRLAQLGAVDPGTDLFLPLEVMKSFGNLQLDAEAGVMFRQFADNQYWSGICGEYDFTKSFALLGEVHLIDTSSFGEDQIVWNIGFKQDLSENQSLIFSAGRTFASPNDDNPSFLMYAGIQVRT
jgi:hypothetical protein